MVFKLAQMSSVYPHFLDFAHSLTVCNKIYVFFFVEKAEYMYKYHHRILENGF